MTNILDNPISQFIIGGTLVSGTAYLANKIDSILAAILATIPLELVTLFFLKKSKLEDYSKSILILSIATVIPVLTFYLLERFKLIASSNTRIILAFVMWLLVSFFIYYFEVR